MTELANNRTVRGWISRRGVLKGGAAVGAMTMFGGTRSFAAAPLRFGIYGSADKLEARGKSIARFAELNPTIPVVYEGVPSAAWPEKIAAMIAGGNAPDVITLSPTDQVQFASRGVVDALEPYVPKIIHADLFSPGVLELGKVNGKLYGLPIAVSIQAMAYNESALKRVGMQLPETFTYDAFAKFCADIHKADKNLYGCHDGAARLADFQSILSAQGKAIVVDNQLGVSVDDVAEWLNFWAEMRKTGATVPADVQAQYGFGEWTNAPIVQGKAVFAMIQTQDLKSGMQALTKDVLAMTGPPRWKGKNGCYATPSSSVLLNAKSTQKESAAFLMDWFVSSPESAKILGLISGPPASNKALAAVKELPDLDRLDKNVLSYAQAALAEANTPPPVHRSENAIRDLMKRVNEDVGFGRSSVADAAKEFISLATREIRRA